MSEKQKTIAKTITLSGVGIHSGKNVNCRVLPSIENSGIRFVRTDLPDNPEVPADVDFVVDVSRGTTLEKNGVRIHTVEHLLSAVTACGIDNLIVEIDNIELPILDGSAKLFYEALSNAEIIEQKAEKNFFVVNENISLFINDRNSEYTLLPYDGYQITVMVDFDSPVLGTQHTTLNNLGEFYHEFAGCRTFSFLHELEFLLKNNLIKGGDLKNAIVVIDKVPPKEELERIAALFNKESINITQPCVLCSPPLKFINEPARHKLLDLVGDLTLVGRPLKGKLFAAKPGHSSNIEFARKIKQIIKNSKMSALNYDLTKKSIFDINQIKKLLPHRPPFLFVDKIIEMDEKHIVGVKNVTINEAFFTGHFPDDPVLPGVIQIEAMAQVGGILVLSSVPDPENYQTLFAKIENARFKQKVIPGDTMVFVLELISPIRRGMCHMKGIAYVGEKVVLEAEMLAQIAPKKEKQ